MNALESKIAKALGKKRMMNVESIFDDGHAIDIQLVNGTGDVWEYEVNGYGDFTIAEVIRYAKAFVDDSTA